MKNTVIFIAILSFLSCKKTSSSSPSPLNTTETSLLGTWYLQKTTDSNGRFYNGSIYIDTVTSYTGYTSVACLTFSSDEYSSVSMGGESNWKKFTDASGLYTGTIFSPTSIYMGMANSDYWYYDNTANCLYNHSVKTTILSLTSSQLILMRNYSSTETYTWYYQK